MLIIKRTACYASNYGDWYRYHGRYAKACSCVLSTKKNEAEEVIQSNVNMSDVFKGGALFEII